MSCVSYGARSSSGLPSVSTWIQSVHGRNGYTERQRGAQLHDTPANGQGLDTIDNKDQKMRSQVEVCALALHVADPVLLSI